MAKYTGDVAQTTEHLLCKPEALSSNPNFHKKKKKKNTKDWVYSSVVQCLPTIFKLGATTAPKNK
jgi:hypothetical protein